MKTAETLQDESQSVCQARWGTEVGIKETCLLLRPAAESVHR